MTMTVDRPPVEAPGAGVIEEARGRQRRHRGITAVAIIAAAGIAAAIVALAGSSGNARTVRGRPITLAGKVTPLSASAVRLYVTPSPTAGRVALNYTVQVSDSHGKLRAYNGFAFWPYPGRGVPAIASEVPKYVRGTTDQPVVMFVAAGVAAVRVGNMGTVAAHSAPGLPPGEKLVAFHVPVHKGPFDGFAPEVTPTALDSHGNALPTTRPVVVLGSQVTVRALLGPIVLRHRPDWLASTGLCEVGTSLAGLDALQGGLALTRIIAQPAAQPGRFLSCLTSRYTFKGVHYGVAILLNAAAPGKPPANLWGSQPLAGHPGIVQIEVPPAMSAGPNAPTPVLARRIDNAWLIEQPLPFNGTHPTPTLAQRIQVLNALRITRLDLSHR